MVMPNVSVLEASKLTGKSSQTIYRHIKRGKLSKTEDGIDTRELMRVYGALRTETPDTPAAPTTTGASVEIDYLKRENQLLREQLANAEERETRMHQQILQRLPAPDGASIVDKIKDKFF
jgi:hypothetical protein